MSVTLLPWISIPKISYKTDSNLWNSSVTDKKMGGRRRRKKRRCFHFLISSRRWKEGREEARGFFYSSIFLFLFGRCCVAVAPKKRQFHGAPGIEMKQKKIFFIISDPDMLIRNHLWGIKRQQSSSKIRETIIPKWNFWVVEKAFFFSFHIFHLFLWGKNRREASAGGGPPLPPLQKLAIHKRTHRSLKKKMEKKERSGRRNFKLWGLASLWWHRWNLERKRP